MAAVVNTNDEQNNVLEVVENFKGECYWKAAIEKDKWL